MTEAGIRPAHRHRMAYIYVCQSSPSQVKRNRESTRRQYALVERARALNGIRLRMESHSF